jgi:cell cycle arrest protein BUB2
MELLMGIKSVSAQEYIKLIKKGPSPVFEKIKNDTHRTFKNDSKFWSKVDEGMLVRVLNAFAWKAQGMFIR